MNSLAITSSPLLKRVVVFGIIGCLTFGAFGMVFAHIYYDVMLSIHEGYVQAYGPDSTCASDIDPALCDDLLEVSQIYLDVIQQLVYAWQYLGFPIGLVGGMLFGVMMHASKRPL